MTEFYATLQKDSDIFAAYRQAVSKVRGITDNPAYWGAFILLGI
jgi:CHAT domain-containing protein